MTEKKVNTMRKIQSVSEKQTDQMLSGAAPTQVYGKIEPKQPTTALQQDKPSQSQPQIQQKPQNMPRQQGRRAMQEGNQTFRSASKEPTPKPEKEVSSEAKKNAANRGRQKNQQPQNAGRNNNDNRTQQAQKDTHKTENTAQPNQQRPRQQKPRGSSQRGRKNPGELPSVKVYFLGGLNEIGKNFTMFECGNDMIIVDCGLAFPNDDMLGIDIVIPDFTFVEKNIDRIRGIVITHGHEDHIGSLPYLLRKIKVPVYGTALTLGLLGAKLKEFNLSGSTKLNVCKAGDHIKLGCFDVEMIHVNHSVSDAVALALHTPAGTLVHTGDFKIDCTPAEGGMIDLGRFAELGKEGVLALFADSTNAERPGYTQTEQKVNDALDTMFKRAENKRIIVATFASSISRVQMIINCAVKYKRKVALSGRSMLNVMSIASELGYLNLPEGLLVDLSMINRYNKNQIVLITTGSQGEPMSALTRMAFAEHRQVEVGPEDFIIISARPIPGNEKTVGNVVDELLKRGCEVIYESMYDLHVSGHACQEELKLMHALTKPKYFIPVHGEQKHLRKHASLAISMGMPPENIFIGDIGKGLEINRDFIKPTADVPAGSVMVDGIGVGDVGSIVLRDRKHLAEDGLIIAVCTIDSLSGRIVSGPDIVSRGFVYVRESEALMEEAKKLAFNAVESCADDDVHEWSVIKVRIRDSLSKFMYEKTRRNPMILPIIMEV